MRYACLVVFFIMAVGGVFASRTKGETVIANARSAAELYSKNCASCHGRDGRAKTSRARRNHARDLSESEWQERVSDERIFNSIMNGKGKMPGYARKISEQEIDALVTYVRSLRK